MIAGNICTDMLRRRSRSTPTDDMELTAQHPVGVVGEDTSEELVLAAVDGELVNRALDRLSTRHRHVLAMREGSGWTYQQIADHEGVEIGTIETLLWRARQALKREFAVVSESKDALAGFLIATGVLFRRSIFRLAHRGASVQQQSGGTGGLRNAVAGVAVTGAAVAAAFIAPHALSERAEPTGGGVGGLGAGGARVRARGSGPGGFDLDTGWDRRRGGREQPRRVVGVFVGRCDGLRFGRRRIGGAGRLRPRRDAVRWIDGGGGVTGGLTNGLNQAAGGLGNTVNGVTGGLGNTVNGVTGGLGNTVNGVTGGVTGTLNNTVNGVTGALNNTVNGLGLGGLLGGTSGAGTSTGTGGGTGTSPASTTTTTTSLLGGLGNTVNSLLGGG